MVRCVTVIIVFVLWLKFYQKESFTIEQKKTLDRIRKELGIQLSQPGETIGIMEKEEELSQMIEALKKVSKKK